MRWKKRKPKPPRRLPEGWRVSFAWWPVLTADGQWAWLEKVWVLGQYKRVRASDGLTGFMYTKEYYDPCVKVRLYNKDIPGEPL